MSSKKKRNKELLKKIEEREKPISKLLHQLFPEEYDLLYDDLVDSKSRKKGINPMSKEYQKKINLRRYELGVEPYMGQVGIENMKISHLITSREYCQNLINSGLS